MSEIIKEVFKGVKKEILYFTDVALISGANNIGKQLLNVTRDERQPSGASFEAFTDALKNGIMATGEELMKVGLERVKAISPQEENSNASEESP